MRPSDIELLLSPLTGTGADHADEVLWEKLRVSAPRVRELAGTIASDIDKQVGGVCWWTGLEPTQNILIADHMLSALRSVQDNLCEVALHRLEYLSTHDDVAKRLARAVSPEGTIALPRAECAADTLPEKFEQLHLAGFFRAVGSVLDCLAVGIVGVVAVPASILKADFQNARRWLKGEQRKKDHRVDLQTTFVGKLDEVLSAAGPAGWIEWADAYRNMYIHRGRRLAIAQLEVEASILNSAGHPIPRTTPVQILLSDASVSTLDSWGRHRVGQMLLHEKADDSLERLTESLLYVVEGVSKLLLEVWANRRLEPTLLAQPKEQWPQTKESAAPFSGFAPGSYNIPASGTFIGNPSVASRLSVTAHLKSSSEDRHEND